MSERVWLYLYENRETRTIYIGIGASLDRVWEDHNSDAVQMRDDTSTQILQTLEPFSSWDDARKAEAVAIHVAALSGLTVLPLDVRGAGDDEPFRLTNRSGTRSTSILAPAVLRRPGEVEYQGLTATAIVTIKAESMNDRPGPYGGLTGAVFSERAQKWWKISSDKQGRVSRLLAILAGSGGVILGDWDVDTAADYGEDGNIFPLTDPNCDDPRGVKGMRLVGVRGQTGPIYSTDVTSRG